MDNKKRKKVRIVIIIAVLLVGFCVSIPVVNNVCADNVKKKLLETPLPANTKVIGSVSRAGKLVGNGNGMQYLGIILIESQLTLEEVQTHYKQYGAHEDEYIIEEKTSLSLNETDIIFSIDEKEEMQYYMVYSWGEGVMPFAELDIRGH